MLKKKKHCIEHSTAANPPPKAHAQKAQRRRVCGSANVRYDEQKIIEMEFNFSFNSNQYDFWELYETIKKYYPLGINRGENGGIYFEYWGIKELERIIIENVHNSKKYNENWGNFTKDLGIELNCEIEGTTYGQAPSLSSSIILESNRIANCLHTKELHFSVSLIGNFFQIYGLDKTSIIDINGNKGYSAVNVVTTSPFQEFKEPFEFVEKKLQEKYPNHRIIPFAFGQTILNGLQVRYLDNEICSVNMAIFNHFLSAENISKFERGDRYYGINNWRKK